MSRRPPYIWRCNVASVYGLSMPAVLICAQERRDVSANPQCDKIVSVVHKWLLLTRQRHNVAVPVDGRIAQFAVTCD